MTHPRLLALAALLAAACGAPAREAGFAYRGPGGSVTGTPAHVQRIGDGRVSFRVDALTVSGADATVRRSISNGGQAPVRVDLGRLRLRTGAGQDLEVLRVCADGALVASLLGEVPAPGKGKKAPPPPAPGERCLDGFAARGRVVTLADGETLAVRTDFGPLDPLEPDGRTPARALARLVLVDDGILVAGRAVQVTVALDRVAAAP